MVHITRKSVFFFFCQVLGLFNVENCCNFLLHHCSSEHEGIKPKILRILNIWQERKIYDTKFVTELKTIMDTGNLCSNVGLSLAACD